MLSLEAGVTDVVARSVETESLLDWRQGLPVENDATGYCRSKIIEGGR